MQPSTVQSSSNLGYKATSFSRGDLNTAIAHSANGEHAKAAKIYEDLGMAPNAAKEYQEASKSEPNLETKAQLHTKAAMVFDKIGLQVKANQQYFNAEANQQYFNAGTCLHSAGKFASAKDMFIKGSKLAGKIDETSIIRASESTYYSKMSQLPTTLDPNGTTYKTADKDARIAAAIVLADHGCARLFIDTCVSLAQTHSISRLDHLNLGRKALFLSDSQSTSRPAVLAAAATTPVAEESLQPVEFSQINFSIQ
jgi:hypothetical protein